MKRVCGAKLRGKNKTCQKPPMANGRCRLHGGKTPSGPDNPNFKHGRYANAFRGRLAEKFGRALTEEKPLDLVPELAVQRAMLEQYVETVSANDAPTIAEMQNVTKLADDVVRTAAAIVKMRNDTALTVAEVKFFQAGMVRLLEKYVPDPDRRRNFVNELRGLIPGRVDANENEPAGLPAFAEAASNPG